MNAGNLPYSYVKIAINNDLQQPHQMLWSKLELLNMKKRKWEPYDR